MVPIERVLVIDDDKFIREFIRMAMIDEGYEVAVAMNGIAGLERVVDFRPSLIILDMLMPLMDGRSFLAAYRRSPRPGVPIIAISVSRKIAAAADSLPVDAFIAKPFDLDTLTDCVKSCLRKAYVA
jgi:two-component system response regulator MprA